MRLDTRLTWSESTASFSRSPSHAMAKYATARTMATMALRRSYLSSRIALFDSHARTWCNDLNRTIWQDSIFRNHLGPKAQRAIARHLMADFKHTFRAYMTGAINNNPDISIAEAIDEFCSDYRITMQQLTIDLLRKDWYRWRMLNQEQPTAPSSWTQHSTRE